MITIDEYTGTWQQALRPTTPRVGTHIRFREDETPDGREVSDIHRTLRDAGLGLEYVRSTPRKWSVYVVVRRDDAQAMGAE